MIGDYGLNLHSWGVLLARSPRFWFRRVVRFAVDFALSGLPQRRVTPGRDVWLTGAELIL